MSSMQDFHEWLSSTVETSEAYQRYLAQLTQASLAQITKVKIELTWHIWNADQPANS